MKSSENEHIEKRLTWDEVFESEFFRSAVEMVVDDMVKEFMEMDTTGVEISEECIQKIQKMIDEIPKKASL